MILSILIVHYKTPDLLRRCLDSIVMQSLSGYEVIVVDNECNPILPKIVAPFNNVILIQNKENIGFGRANNQAAVKAIGKHFFLLNPDACFLKSDDLSRVLNFARQHQEVGLVGVKILDNTHHELSPPKTKYPGLKHYNGPLFDDLPGDIAWVSGAGFLILGNLFKKVRGFDPDFFLYAEEIDLCLRVRKEGYSIGYCQDVAIEHAEGASQRSISTYEHSLIGHRGLYLFFIKHYPAQLWRRRLKRDIRRTTRKLLTLWLCSKIFKKRNFSKEQEHHQAIKYCALRALKEPEWLKFE